MNLMKKSVSAVLALAMAASLGACTIGSGTSWVAKMGEETIPAGVYIGELMNAYYTATAELPPDTKNPLKEQVDGVTVSQKVSEDAKKALNEYLAVEKKFSELGLEIDPLTKSSIDQTVEGYWPYIGKTYQDNGISKESYAKVFLNDSKKSRIFQSIYGEGGAEPVPEAELKEKFTKDFAKIIMIPLTFDQADDSDGGGSEADDADAAAKKEENAQKAREMMDKYEKSLKDGAGMEDVYYDARKEISKDDTLEKPEPGTSYTFVNRENSQYDEKVTEAIFAAKNGEPTRVETDSSIYLFMRYDITENESDFTSRKDTLINLLRGDAFEEKIAEWAGALTDVTINDAALKRYTPEKLKMD